MDVNIYTQILNFFEFEGRGRHPRKPHSPHALAFCQASRRWKLSSPLWRVAMFISQIWVEPAASVMSKSERKKWRSGITWLQEWQSSYFTLWFGLSSGNIAHKSGWIISGRALCLGLDSDRLWLMHVWIWTVPLRKKFFTRPCSWHVVPPIFATRGGLDHLQHSSRLHWRHGMVTTGDGMVITADFGFRVPIKITAKSDVRGSVEL